MPRTIKNWSVEKALQHQGSAATTQNIKRHQKKRTKNWDLFDVFSCWPAHPLLQWSPMNCCTHMHVCMCVRAIVCVCVCLCVCMHVNVAVCICDGSGTWCKVCTVCMYMWFCLPGGKCAAAVQWPICTTGCCSQCQQIHIWPDAQSAPWWTSKNRHKNIHQTKSLLMNNMSVLTNARAKNNQSTEWHNHYYFLRSKQSFSRLKLLFNYASSQTSDSKISVSMEIHKSVTEKQLVLKYSFVHFSLFKNDPCHSSSDWILSTDKRNLMSEFCRLNECPLWSFLLLEYDLQFMLLFTDSYGVGVGDGGGGGGGWLITDLEDDEEEVLLLASCCLQSLLHAFNHILCGYLLVWENLHPVSLLSPWQQHM